MILGFKDGATNFYARFFPARIGQEGVKVFRDKQVAGMGRKMRDKAALLIRKGKESKRKKFLKEVRHIGVSI